MMSFTLERPKINENKGIDAVDSNQTILLAIPPKEKQRRYRFKQMLNYCAETNKVISELTIEEKEQFII